MNVVYLTWGETPRSYGVFGSQVLSQFYFTKNIMPTSNFYFISGLPILNSGFTREKWRYLNEIKKVRNKLDGIDFYLTPIFAPQNFVNSSRFTFNFMHYFAHKILYKKILSINPSVVHCRSYHAAWAAISIKEKYCLNFKIVFDGRGLWPEEVSLKKCYGKDSLNYKFLKKIESEVISKSDATVSVSDTMHKHYLELGSKNDFKIYLSADTERIKTDLKIRNNQEIVRFCYVGALSCDTWHKPVELFKLYSYLRTIFPKTKLTIVTTSSLDPIKNCFKEIPDTEIQYCSTKTLDELKSILVNQDFGLMTYFKPTSSDEVLLGDMVLAVKTVEYFSAGLPVICNKYCGGAAYLIDSFGLGANYDPDDIFLDSDILMNMLQLENRERIQHFSEMNFDYSINGKKYSAIYNSLVLE